MRRRLRDSEVEAFVLISGSGTIQARRGRCDKGPWCFPSVVGRPMCRREMIGGGSGTTKVKPTYIGDEAQSLRGILNITYPVEHGVVVNWDDMEKIWYHTFYNEHHIDPSEYTMMLGEAPLNPSSNRAKMYQVLFETFDVPAAYVASIPLLVMLASGRSTGIAVHCGDGVTHATAINEYFPIPESIQRVDFGGRDLTEYLMRLSAQAGYPLRTSAEREVARQMKEKLCYVALDYEEQLRMTQELEQIYELPDGDLITLSEERFRCGEAVFQPSLVGMQWKGIHEMTARAIQRCDVHVRRDLYGNIILSGGTTMLPGFSDRMTKELVNLMPSRARVKVVTPPERKYSSWIGGSILAGLSSMQPCWATKEMWDETGYIPPSDLEPWAQGRCS